MKTHSSKQQASKRAHACIVNFLHSSTSHLPQHTFSSKITKSPHPLGSALALALAHPRLFGQITFSVKLYNPVPSIHKTADMGAKPKVTGMDLSSLTKMPANVAKDPHFKRAAIYSMTKHTIRQQTGSRLVARSTSNSQA